MEPYVKAPVQFILDQHESPVFAVLPYAEYMRLIANQNDAHSMAPALSLLSEDGRHIRLPHGGPDAQLDIVELLLVLKARGITDLAINQRAQTLQKFPDDQADTLDPIIRRELLGQDSPYKNTMQAVTEVVDALVETGIFSRAKKSYPCFYRPVNALVVDQEIASRFVQAHT